MQMKIDLMNIDQGIPEAGGSAAASLMKPQEEPGRARQLGNASGIAVDLGNNALNGMRAYEKKHRSPLEGLSAPQAQDEMLNRNYMAVMANTMSGRDFKELVEQGYAPGEMQPEDAVNSLDRMKAELARAGIHVAGYTDMVSEEALEEVTGSAALARELSKGAGIQGEARPLPDDMGYASGVMPEEGRIAEGLEELDLPATEANIRSVRDAYRIADELKPLSDASLKYMIENGMEPRISDVFEAEFSAGGSIPSGNAGYFSSDDGTNGYLARAVPVAEEGNEGLNRQMDEVIREAGFQPTDEKREDAKWILNHGIPLNTETLSSYESLRSLDPKPDFTEMARALSEGRPARDAYLIRGYRQVRADRILKETALAMTSEANRRLLKSDMNIDTTKLEEEVSSLKQEESRLWRLVDETLSAVSELKEAPAELITEYAFPPARSEAFLKDIPGDEITLQALRDEGGRLSLRYREAEKLYEAVGTEVRPDLGDHIQKAFQNVDDILGELGLERTDQNRRSVRMLGYNSMEITPENIGRMKEADEKVNRVLDAMTPPNVLKLIREQVNPLSVGLDELDERLARYSEEEEQTQESFARYLVKLQHAGEVTQEEAASYIGIFRLVDKIAKNDGAVIGALVNASSGLSMKNLLSSLRSGKRGHMDFLIDENFGGIDRVEDAAARKIDVQIATAFGDDYYDEEAKQFAEAAKVEAELYRMLEEADTSASANHVHAAMELFAGEAWKNGFFGKLLNGSGESSRKRLNDMAKRAIDSMDEAEEFAECYDEMVNAEVVAAFDRKDVRIDIRAMQLQAKVFSLQKTLADSRNYQIPVEFEGRTATINLKIRHGENAGMVDIVFEDEMLGRIEAKFSLAGGTTEGIAACESRAGYEFLKAKQEEIRQAVSLGERQAAMDVVYATGQGMDQRPVNAKDGQATDTTVLYRTAKAFIGGIIHEDQ